MGNIDIIETLNTRVHFSRKGPTTVEPDTCDSYSKYLILTVPDTDNIPVIHKAGTSSN